MSQGWRRPIKFNTFWPILLVRPDFDWSWSLWQLTFSKLTGGPSRHYYSRCAYSILFGFRGKVNWGWWCLYWGCESYSTAAKGSVLQTGQMIDVISQTKLTTDVNPECSSDTSRLLGRLYLQDRWSLPKIHTGVALVQSVCTLARCPSSLKAYAGILCGRTWEATYGWPWGDLFPPTWSETLLTE